MRLHFIAYVLSIGIVFFWENTAQPGELLVARSAPPQVNPTHKYLILRSMDNALFPEGTHVRILERDNPNYKFVDKTDPLPATPDALQAFGVSKVFRDVLDERGRTGARFPTTEHGNKTYLVYALVPDSDILYVSVNNNANAPSPLFDKLYSGNIFMFPAHDIAGFSVDLPGAEQEKVESIARVQTTLFEPGIEPQFLAWALAINAVLFLYYVFRFGSHAARRRLDIPDHEAFSSADPYTRLRAEFESVQKENTWLKESLRRNVANLKRSEEKHLGLSQLLSNALNRITQLERERGMSAKHKSPHKPSVEGFPEWAGPDPIIHESVKRRRPFAPPGSEQDSD